jgi:hypothetical protein
MKKQDKKNLKQFIDLIYNDRQYFIAENIAEKTKHLDGKNNREAINYVYRQMNESHLWPINNKFDVTERAIRKIRKQEQFTEKSYGLEYCLALENEISDIVNNENN